MILNDSRKAIDSMVTSILKAVKKAVDKECHYDKTFTANVVGKDSDTKGWVSWKGEVYKVQSSVPFENGDLVRVCAPCNDFNDLFIVENRTTSGIYKKK